MIRFAEVMPGVLRGGEPSVEDLVILKNVWGVKRILSLDDDVGFKIHSMCEKLDIEQIIFPTAHAPSVKQQVINLKNNIVSLFSVRPIYVHCFHGSDRTGLAIALFRISNGWSPVDALKEADSFNFGAKVSNEIKNIFTEAILDAYDSNNTDDIVSKERNDFDTTPEVNSARNSFDSGIPPEENETMLTDDSSINKIRKRRQKLRKALLEDMNNAMAGVGGYENNNPVLRGLGPIEPFGIYPFGYSMIY